jgi:hypothetical protein
VFTGRDRLHKEETGFEDLKGFRGLAAAKLGRNRDPEKKGGKMSKLKAPTWPRREKTNQ